MRTAEDWVNERTWANDEGRLRVIEMVKLVQLDALRFAREHYKNLPFGQADAAILARIKEVEE